MSWREEAAQVVQSFDDALGRPPFPQEPTEDLVAKATAVYCTIDQVVSAGKLKSLEGVREVTTTLPILCASLKEGSPDRKPSLALYRPVLLAVGLASTLSTYPISHILSDAKVLLGASLYDVTPQTVTSSANADSITRDEVTLFKFMTTTRSLTPDDMRRFLRMPLPSSNCAPLTSKKKNGSNGSKGNGKEPPASASKVSACEKPSTPSTVSRGLLKAMIDASLADDCRQVFESFVDNTQKFLDVVGCDGDLASRILEVYGARLVPRLKPSSLLPCLNAALLDYFVDVVACSQKNGLSTLLVSKELREIPLKLWEADRVHHLAVAAASRSVRPEEAMPSLLGYTFLYVIYLELEDRNAATESASLAVVDADQFPSREFSTESLFVFAVLRAMHAVLLADKESEPKTPSSLRTYVQANTRVLVVHGGDAPTWLSPLSRFVQLFLSRKAAVALITAEQTVEEGCLDAEKEKVLSQGVTKLLMNTLSSLFSALAKAAPKAEQNSAVSAAPRQTQKANAVKSKGKPIEITKGGKATNTADVKAARELLPPLPLSELLSSCSGLLLFSSLLQRSVSTVNVLLSQTDVLSALLRSYVYLLQHQPQRLNAALWQNCLHFITYSLWIQVNNPSCGLSGNNDLSSCAAGPIPLEGLVAVLSAVTASTDCMLWLSPLVLSSSVAQSTAHVPIDVAKLTSANSELRLAIVQAVVNTHNFTAPYSTSPLCQQLFPAPPIYVFGALCSAADETVLQLLAADIVTATADRSTVMTASLQRMHQDTNFDQVFSSIKSPFLCDCVPASVAQRGLQRLLDMMTILQAGHFAIQQAAEAGAKATTQRAMHEQLQRSHELAAAHQTFLMAAQSKQDATAAKKREVQAEAARRRALEAARINEDAAVRARKRQNALETLKRKAEQTRAQREIVRRARFAAYQRRLESEYRVTTFLEHLNLSSARVMEARDALRKVIDTITPDDLLEFLVSGEAKVPSDMMADGEETPSTGEAATAEIPSATLPKPSREALRYVEERRDFWAEIMDDAVPAKSPTASSAFLTAATSASSSSSAPQDSSSPAYRKQSFHKRVSPLLDLFFYEDGDEYGNVPDILPTLHLRLANRVWPPARTRTLGFANLREAYESMEQRGLVQMRNGIVQLTLLGFRYHFPFHDPDGMLEVYLREARERVRALVVYHHGSDGDHLDEGNESEKEEAGEYDEEGFTDDEEDDVADNAGRLLPELEFGI